MTNTEISVDEVFDETMRLSDVSELADRLVWIWRITSYRLRCQDGICNLAEPTPDPTVLTLNFRDALLEGLKLTTAPDANLIKLAELLSIQTGKRSQNIDIRAPEHLWAAAEDTNAHCSCGWIGYEADFEAAGQAWEEHAADSGLALEQWQLDWLDEFNRKD
jgi:hypothetical protein